MADFKAAFLIFKAVMSRLKKNEAV